MSDFIIPDEKKMEIASQNNTVEMIILGMGLLVLYYFIINFLQGFSLTPMMLVIVVLFFPLLFCVGAWIALRLYVRKYLDVVYKLDEDSFSIIKNGSICETIPKNEIHKIAINKDLKTVFIQRDGKKSEIKINGNVVDYDNFISELNNLCETSNKPDSLETAVVFIIMSMLAPVSFFYLILGNIQELRLLAGFIVIPPKFLMITTIYYSSKIGKKRKIFICGGSLFVVIPMFLLFFLSAALLL